MLSIYSMYPVYYPPENLTRNHFGLTGAWSRVRSHMGSAYFSLPSGWAQPNMHKAQCRGHPVCAPGSSRGMQGAILLPLVVSLEKLPEYGWMGRAASAGASGSSCMDGGPGSKQTTSTSSPTSQKHYQKQNLAKEANS